MLRRLIEWGAVALFVTSSLIGAGALLACWDHVNTRERGRVMVAPDVAIVGCEFTPGACPDDVTLVIVGGWPSDPLDRCWLAMDMAGLDYSVCDDVKSNLG